MEFVYFITKIFVSVCNWIEYPFLCLFSGTVERFYTQFMKRLGVSWDPSMKQENSSDKVLIRVKDKKLFVRLASTGHLAMGEGYVNGDWDYVNDENDITELVARSMKSNILRVQYNWWKRLLHRFEYDCINLQSCRKAWEVGKKHYDLGNAFFESFLDRNMQYSCGYWADAEDLESAQINKMNLIARKLDLKPGMRVLDIGCGWGTLSKYLVENFGVKCVGLTVSKEGYQYAKQVCKGLPVRICLEDYRKIDKDFGLFDRIVSIEMFEHVGYRNYRDFFKVAHRFLKDDGIFLLHTITNTDLSIPRIEPWVHTYVFPNISPAYPFEICKAIDGLFILDDWHNLTIDFERTFRAWRENFKLNYPSICHLYDDKFYRMWMYFLSTSCGAFKSKKYQLAHIVLTKSGFNNRYIVAR